MKFKKKIILFPKSSFDVNLQSISKLKRNCSFKARKSDDEDEEDYERPDPGKISFLK